MDLSFKKKINYGIELLRMMMSFWVILKHFYSPKNKIISNIIISHSFHVPTFFIISFFFLYHSLTFRIIKKMKDRIERLLIPYIIYPVLTFAIRKLLYNFFNYEWLKTSIYQLIRQFIVGRSLYPVLWFHFNLILITLLFNIISFIFKKNYLSILQILAILSYYLQLSGVNFQYFNIYKTTICFSVGYFAETIPIAVTGLSIASIDTINKLKKKRFMTYFFSISFLFIIFKYDLFIKIKGFGKQGLMRILGGIFFFLIFSLIPLENCNEKTLNYIKNLTSYTPGIYFLHGKIYTIFRDKISLIKAKTFLGCILNYLICYSISTLCYNLFKNTKLKFLFI